MKLPHTLSSSLLLVILSTVQVSHASAQSCASDPEEPSHILFLSDRPGGDRDGNWDLYRAKIDGSNVQRVTDFSDHSIRWFYIHRDSGRIVLAGSQKGNLKIGPSGKDGGPAEAEEKIAILEVDGRVKVLLDVLDKTLNPEHFTTVWHPTFSPDGNYIVFGAAKARQSNNLWIMKSDGSALTQLLPDPHRTQNDPRFTSDGRVVYVRHNRTGIGQILNANGLDTWVIDPIDPSSNQRLTVESNIQGKAQLETDPALNPDCGWFVTSRLKSLIPPKNALSVMRADGQSTDFADTLTSKDTNGLLGIATWINNEEMLSYTWVADEKGWRVIRFSRLKPGKFEFIPLQTPNGYRDVIPMAY